MDWEGLERVSRLRRSLGLRVEFFPFIFLNASIFRTLDSLFSPPLV